MFQMVAHMFDSLTTVGLSSQQPRFDDREAVIACCATNAVLSVITQSAAVVVDCRLDQIQ